MIYGQIGCTLMLTFPEPAELVNSLQILRHIPDLLLDNIGIYRQLDIHSWDRRHHASIWSESSGCSAWAHLVRRRLCARSNDLRKIAPS